MSAGEASSTRLSAAPDVVKALRDADDKQAEYWLHVSAQSELPIAAGREMPSSVDALLELIDDWASVASAEDRAMCT